MRKLTALFILIVVFIPLAFAAMTLTAIRPWVLDRGFYERIVSDEGLYEAMLTEELPRRFYHDAFMEVEQLPLDALSIALREVLTVDYLRTQSLNVVDKVFDYLEGRERNFELSLDISPIKTALAGEARTRFASALAAALPTCDTGQEPIAPSGRLTRCIAAGESLGSAAEQIAAALPAVLENTPDQIILNDGTPYIRMNWYDFGWLLGGSILAGLNLAILMAIFSAVAAAVVGAYLGGDDLHGRLKWFSSALFLPGCLFLLAGLALTSPYIVGPISWGIASVRYSDAFREAVGNAMLPVIQQIGGGILITGLVASLIALALLILSLATPASGTQRPRMVQVPARNP